MTDLKMDIIFLLVSPSNTCKNCSYFWMGRILDEIHFTIFPILFLRNHTENSFHVVYKVAVPWRA